MHIWPARALACPWLDELADATAAQDPDRIDAAVTTLQESKTWPILREMDARGDYPEVVWDYADEAEAGRVPERYDGGLGFATTERTLALRVAWRRWAPRVTTRRRPARAAG